MLKAATLTFLTHWFLKLTCLSVKIYYFPLQIKPVKVNLKL